MSAKCELCGVEIEDWCDVCDKHAMTNEQLGEMAWRVQKAMNDYRLEIWPDLRHAEPLRRRLPKQVVLVIGRREHARL